MISPLHETPLSFNESRTGILVYLRKDIFRAIDFSGEKKFFIRAEVSVVSKGMRTFTPFSISISVKGKKETKENISSFPEALRIGQNTDDGTVASVYDKNNALICTIDAT